MGPPTLDSRRSAHRRSAAVVWAPPTGFLASYSSFPFVVLLLALAGAGEVDCWALPLFGGVAVRPSGSRTRPGALWDAPAVRAGATEAGVGGSRGDSDVDPAPPAAPRPPDWLDRARQLREYRNRHGHTRVPRRSPDGLGAWVHKQRQRRHRLSRAQIDTLDRLNFCWNVSAPLDSDVADEAATTSLGRPSTLDCGGDKDATWWVQFRALTKRFPNALEPAVADPTEAGSELSSWLSQQRKRAASLRPRELAALAAWDPRWDWAPRQLRWEARLRELADYKAAHGDCCVPISYRSADPTPSGAGGGSLAQWVSNQRKQYNLRRRGRPSALTDERYRKLSRLGFVWSMDQRVSDRWGVHSESSMER